MKFEVYREGDANKLSTILGGGSGDWRWRLRADNGRIIATGGEGYNNKADCLHGIQLVMSATSATTVYDQEGARSLLFIGGKWI
ncbi:YegP family protein [Stenotrophomonas indicatrix]|uniref:YegP family protein n=1 Tax=Stenotrophomonas indicatrix TaxID=2045451 RepID=UPI001CBE5585|nr:DUF1508 domain-containing protein [Stenotrophomonas indicatrix]